MSINRGDLASFPPNPIEKPKTDLGREALRLYDAIQEATGRCRVAREAESEAANALRDARTALERYFADSGASGELDAAREQELAEAFRRAEIAADSQLHGSRKRAALEGQHQAVNTWRNFIAANVAELLESELAPDAHKASDKLIRALEAARPAETEYQATAGRVRALVGVLAEGPDAQRMHQLWALAEVPAPPLPHPNLWKATDEPDIEDELAEPVAP
jgi:hypothetical protein